ILDSPHFILDSVSFTARVAMDLNASPVPEDDEDVFEERVHVQEYIAPEERIESGAEIARREREERKRRLKRERPDDNRSVHQSQSPRHDQQFHTKNPKSYDTSRLPPGWLDCPASGQEICCMIPSKVPLGESFNDCIFPGKRYSFKQVIHQQRVLGRKLGLVIDLTNTSRYYPVTDLKKEGIKHVKIQCRGRDSVPENSSVNQFVYEVIQFLSRQKQSKKYILVHCTHGHNRTGYMIIHYLMRAMSMSVTQAIKIFSEARPPGIYKPDYIDALYAFYHEKKPEMVVCPPTPEWKRSSEFDLNGEAVPDDDDDGLPGPDLQENHETAQMTNDDVLGDEIPADQQDAFRQFCYQTLRLGVGARGHAQFPGSHPVSLNSSVLFYANLEFSTSGQIIRVFPGIPRLASSTYYPVRRKDFWLLSTVQKLLKEFIKRLSHEADGLIFQGWDDPYVPRTHEGLLKWKYANLNSVDFLFEVEGDRELLFVNERGKKKLMDGNKVAFKDGSDPSLYSGKIIECTWDFDNLEWIFLRIRTDKSTPNEFNTYRKVMRSIKDNITEEDLLNEINEIIRLPMYADRIKTDSKATQHANAAKRR
ncbi:hypothetical protein TSUD_262660, partial [Trifolium subterraneum]